MKRASLIVAVFGLVAVLIAANHTIWQRQQVVDNGQPVLLDLRPVDPRSLIQGDYMVLRYAETVFPPRAERAELEARGSFVVRLDENDVASFSRFDGGGPLSEREVRLKYKQIDRHGTIRLGAESFFFEEGKAETFNGARYGVLHVDDAGNSVLVGLAGEDWQMIRPQDD